MATPDRAAINRNNALKSTGPKTANGIAKSSRNAMKSGLFARVLVIPAIGETLMDFELLRGRIINDLEPAGVMEAEIVERIAGILWRLRRVTRYETAVFTQSIGRLPMHPDQVTGREVDLAFPMPPTASTAIRLAYTRARLGRGPQGDCHRREAEMLRDLNKLPDTGEIDILTIYSVKAAVSAVLTCPIEKYDQVLAQHQVPNPDRGAWSVEMLRQVLAVVAKEVAVSLDDFHAKVAAELVKRAAAADIDHTKLLEQERELVQVMLEERERAGVAMALSDDNVLNRVIKAETHFSRELTRAVALLQRLRATRLLDGGWLAEMAMTAASPGFVLPHQNGDVMIGPAMLGANDRIEQDNRCGVK